MYGLIFASAELFQSGVRGVFWSVAHLLHQAGPCQLTHTEQYIVRDAGFLVTASRTAFVPRSTRTRHIFHCHLWLKHRPAPIYIFFDSEKKIYRGERPVPCLVCSRCSHPRGPASCHPNGKSQGRDFHPCGRLAHAMLLAASCLQAWQSRTNHPMGGARQVRAQPMPGHYPGSIQAPP